ncbi:uncharacterized protein LOC119076064 [Bradysia coprophila]|uniref:uncharacterized protein LOC119076064 n=1 Tax=Bradysia coprophila TaxID=38358 RepID=UPI00187D7E33|nr:uncharacterized protein LOC119076064 [Bradysia coprophila]
MPPFQGLVPTLTEKSNQMSTASTSSAARSSTAAQQNNVTTNQQRLPFGSVSVSNRSAVLLPPNIIIGCRSLRRTLPTLSYTRKFFGVSVPERPLHLPFPVINTVSANIPLPPNWNANMEKVAQSLDPYQLFAVDSKSQEFRKLEKLLDPLNVCYIDRIVNPTVWTRFVNARNEMLKAKCNDPMVLTELGLSHEEIARRQQSLNFLRHNAVDAAPFDDNFALLFHCTRDRQNVEQIQRDGFDERLSNGGILGRGIYFTDSSRKAISYDRSNSGVLFICGVLLGDCITHKDSAGFGSLKEPEKLPAERRYIDDNNFDSAMGQLKFNEYAVYNRYQCYPLYRVVYSRLQSRFDHSSDYVTPPPFRWLAENEFRKLADNSTWPFHAKTVFEEINGSKETTRQIKRSAAPTRESIGTKSSRQTLNENLKILTSEILKGPDHADEEEKENDFPVGSAFRQNSCENIRQEAAAANESKIMESLLNGETLNDILPKKIQMASSTTGPL